MIRGVWAAVNIRVSERFSHWSVIARKKKFVPHLREEQPGDLTSLESHG